MSDKTYTEPAIEVADLAVITSIPPANIRAWGDITFVGEDKDRVTVRSVLDKFVTAAQQLPQTMTAEGDHTVQLHAWRPSGDMASLINRLPDAADRRYYTGKLVTNIPRLDNGR